MMALRSIRFIVLAAAEMSLHAVALCREGLEHKVFVDQSRPTSVSVATYEVGDKKFAIPLSYVRPGENKRGGPTTGINLRALLPGFQGYDRATQQEFDRSSSDRLINIRLSIHDAAAFGRTFPLMTRAAIYARITRDARTGNARELSEQHGPFGLTRVYLTPNWEKDLFAGRKSNGDFFWVLCSRASVINPRCDTQVEYSRHVTIAYHFPKKRLSEWAELDERVLIFVRQFDQ